MRRIPALDPPEYVGWTPDPALVRSFRETTQRDPTRAAIIARLSIEDHLDLYAGLLRARLHDRQLARWVRGGVLAKAWLGTGEEATTIGPCRALHPDRDVVAPMIRNAAACFEMGMPLVDVLRAALGTPDSPSGGHDVHVGDLARGVLQPISHVGDMVPVVTGVALANKLRDEARIALTWIGDGAANTAAAHEGLNFAAVQRLPALFVLQNNQVALGTPIARHHVPPDFRDWPKSYGMWSAAFDGNNVLDALAASVTAAERCRRGDGPAMLLADTFRMGGHATHDELEARTTLPAELFAAWGRRDPIGLYEEYLKEEGLADQRLGEVERVVEAEVDRAAAAALASLEDAGPDRYALRRVFVDRAATEGPAC